MKRVAIVGAAQTRYGLFPEKTLKELMAECASELFRSVGKGMAPTDVEAVFIGNLGTGGSQLGNLAPLMAEAAGMVGAPATHIENACASSGFALRMAVAAIASGQSQIAVAGGVEKMSDLPRRRNRLWLGISGDVEWERLAGTNFPGIYAMMARRHMHEFGTRKEDITAVAVKNRENAVLNPKAQLRKPLTLEAALKSGNLAAPFCLADACPVTDGASLIVLADWETAIALTDRPIEVVGSGAATDFLAIHDRPSLTSLPATRRAAHEAYTMAGIQPADIGLAEVHDCFTIGEILAYSDLGFCEPAEAGRWVEAGRTRRNGQLPVNVSGGLTGKGHPIGATGTGQICELFQQLRGEAAEPSRQVNPARYALAHNVGGSGGSVAVHILKGLG